MVAMNVWPTDAADGAVSSEARWRKMARQWIPSGVIDNVGGEMVPSLVGLNLTVQDGAAWADGHYTELPGTQVLAVTANGLAVVRFDPAANTAELLYRDGVSVPNQVVGGVWEVPIARISGSALLDVRGRLVNPGNVNQLFTYSVPRISFKGNVSTDANGEFAVSTGFTPTMAYCVGAQFAFPTIAILNLFTAVQVSFRMLNYPANTPAGPSSIVVHYVIFGPPVQAP